MKSERFFQSIMNELNIKDQLIFTYENQNSDYEGSLLKINSHIYRTRLAKLTPKKSGYFVAFWEKNTNGTNQAYSYEQSPEKLIVSIIDGDKQGQFIFPKYVLLKYGILRDSKQNGKMALRVYPSWITNLNETATKTQAWQVGYFIDLSDGYKIKKLMKMYFS